MELLRVIDLTIKQAQDAIEEWEKTRFGRQVNVMGVGVESDDQEVWGEHDGSICERLWATVIVNGNEREMIYYWDCVNKRISDAYVMLNEDGDNVTELDYETNQ